MFLHQRASSPSFVECLRWKLDPVLAAQRKKGGAVTRPRFVWGEPWLLQKRWREGVEMWVRFIKITFGLQVASLSGLSKHGKEPFLVPFFFAYSPVLGFEFSVIPLPEKQLYEP